MGTTKTVTVNWDAGINGPTAPDITVNQSDGQTTIEWNAGTDVQNVTIVDLDSTEFTNLSGNGTSQITVTDKNDNTVNKSYGYTIQAQHKNGTRGSHDPKIFNAGRPSLKPSVGRAAEPTAD